MVVNDANYNRLKVKNWKYVVKAHYVSSMTLREMAEIVLKGEAGEFLTYFPEYKLVFDEMTEKYNALIAQIKSIMDEALEDYEKVGKDRKEFTKVWTAKKTGQTTAWGFSAINGKTPIEEVHYLHYRRNKLIGYLRPDK